MATKTEVRLVDDLDNESSAAETVSFGFGSTANEIDLSEPNAKEFRTVLDRYVSAVRKVSKAGRPAPVRTENSFDPAAVRAWAKGQGIEVNERGRIKSDVVAQFRAAGN